MAGVELPSDIEGYKLLRKTNRQELVATIKAEVRTGTARQAFQDAAIQEAKERGDKEKARRIQQVQRAEAVSQVWKKCAHARGGISHVYVPEDPREDPKECTNWKKLEDPKRWSRQSMIDFRSILDKPNNAHGQHHH
jgi:hypothetical protein